MAVRPDVRRARRMGFGPWKKRSSGGLIVVTRVTMKIADAKDVFPRGKCMAPILRFEERLFFGRL
jgi:hypothetical protein